MRVERASIPDVFFIHSNLREFYYDVGEEFTLKPEKWLECFNNPFFECFIGFHGKRQTVGQIWGVRDPFTGKFMVGGLFVRRKFRGKIKFLRPLLVAFKRHLKENGITKIVYVASDKTQAKAVKRGFKLDGFILQRGA